jgi:hypothetical protein
VKLGPLDISRRRTFAAVAVPQRGELGQDNDHYLNRWAGGGPDPNVILTGRQKFEIYDEMAWSDVHCRALLAMTRLPAVGAIWDFEPADGPQGELVAEALRWQFGLGDYDGQLDRSWKQVLTRKHLKFRYGSWFDELVWGDPVIFNGRLIRPLRRLAPRSPRTIGNVDYENGRIVEVVQTVPDAKPIPGDKIVWNVLDEEPGRWDGVSLLRAAWGPWELKKQIMISAGIAWDRWAAGFPEVHYPQSGGAAQAAIAEEIGRDIRNHERGYVAFQGPPSSENYPEGWSIDIKGGPSNLPDPTPLLKEYSLEILWAGLVQWMGIATSSHTGARATAQVQDEPYYMAIEAHAADLAMEIQRQEVRRFVDVNFGEEIPTPKLIVSKIQSEDVASLATTMSNLKLAGFDFSDKPTQDDVRERMHLPDLPDDWAGGQPTEGSGLPAPPRLAPVPATAEEKAAAQARAAERREERLLRSFERASDRGHELLVAALAQREQQLPIAPPTPVIVPVTVPANTPDERLIEMFEASQERMLEQLGKERELPPMVFELKTGKRRTTARKVDGEWVIDADGD